MTEEELFHAALAIPISERAAFLDKACADDLPLRSAVDALLAAHEASGMFFESDWPLAGSSEESPAVTLDSESAEGGEHAATRERFADTDAAQEADSRPMATADIPRDSAAGVVIGGRYTLREKIGTGGMGEVWVAKQTEPIRRKVALKLIKTGMNSRIVLQRFEQERQALAMMDHPNIARVLDGGMTPTGHPYFVMELVKGLPLTQFCDEMKLTPRARLELFVPICQAVQHAHQKGVVHRDLKPANILVTTIDGKPVPKVIDFGVAKATSGKLTEETMSTGFGAVVGTLEYMSPEQSGFLGEDVDTRADIYSLGVILYELLTGLRPIDAKRLRTVALAEMIRIIQDEEPPKPSTRLSTDESMPSLAALRQTEPSKLMLLLRGELDWVVMKCLEKQRDRRYETANALARDVQRYLADELVEARPPSKGYRLQKFVRKHKGQVIAAGLVFLTLLAGVIGTSIGIVEAKRQESLARTEADAKELALKAEAEQRRAAVAAAAQEKVAKEQTKKRLQQVEKGVELFAGMLSGINPRMEEMGGEPLYVQLRRRAEQAADELDPESVGDPLAVARLQTILGNTLLELGSTTKAEKLLEKARQTRVRELGSDHDDTLVTLAYLAKAYHRTGKFSEAIDLFEQVRETQSRTLGAENPFTLVTLGFLAKAYHEAGRLPEAISLFEQVRDLQMRELGAGHLDTLSTLHSLAHAYQETWRLPEAIATLEQVRDEQVKQLGAEHPDSLITLNNLARAYQDSGKLAEATALLEQVRDAQIKKLGAVHPGTLTLLNNLAMAHYAAGKLDESTALFEQVRDEQVRQLGANHPDTLITLNNLANAYQDTGRLTEATVLYQQTFEASVEKLGPNHPHTLVRLNNLAAAYWEAKQFEKSVPLFERLLKHWETELGREHFNTQRMVANLGINYKDAGRLEKALPLMEEAYQSSREHRQLRFVATALLDGYVRAGKPNEAAQLASELLAEARNEVPEDGPELAGALAFFGLSLLTCEAFAEAEPMLRECLAIREKHVPDSWLTFNAQSMLGGALLGQGKYADAETLLLSGYQGMKKREAMISDQGRDRLTETLDRLIELYTATDRPDEVKKWQAERAKDSPSTDSTTESN